MRAKEALKRRKVEATALADRAHMAKASAARALGRRLRRTTLAHQALLAARATAPTAMAAQLKWLADTKGEVAEEQDAIMEHIAEQLEALTGGVVLSNDAAAQIRAALVGALRDEGIIDPDEPPSSSSSTRSTSIWS